MLLEAQDRSRWDQLLVRRGLAALRACGAARRAREARREVLPAGIDRGTARPCRGAPRTRTGAASRALYDVLAEAAPGPIVEVNRAVAHGRAFDPDAGLAVLDALPGALGDSPLVPSVRGDLLERAGRHADAATLFREAASLTSNESEQSLLLGRADESQRASAQGG